MKRPIELEALLTWNSAWNFRAEIITDTLNLAADHRHHPASPDLVDATFSYRRSMSVTGPESSILLGLLRHIYGTCGIDTSDLIARLQTLMFVGDVPRSAWPDRTIVTGDAK
jgi:hypothetical protein